MEKPIVTVLVACYKNNDPLWKTLDSILRQDYLNIQLIISDDASGSFDLEKVRKYCSGKVETIVNENSQNLGTVRHLNMLLQLVEGMYIKLLSPGDTFLRTGSLGEMVEAIGDADVLVSPALANTGKVKYLSPSIKTIIRLKNTRCLEHELYARNDINMIGTMFRFDGITKFVEEYFLIEDWPLWLRLARQGKKFEFRETAYCAYALGGISTSGGNEKFNADVIKLYETEILPKINDCTHRIQREARFEYEKKLHGRHVTKALLCIKYPEVSTRRVFERLGNMRYKCED